MSKIVKGPWSAQVRRPCQVVQNDVCRFSVSSLLRTEHVSGRMFVVGLMARSSDRPRSPRRENSSLNDPLASVYLYDRDYLLSSVPCHYSRLCGGVNSLGENLMAPSNRKKSTHCVRIYLFFCLSNLYGARGRNTRESS